MLISSIFAIISLSLISITIHLLVREWKDRGKNLWQSPYRKSDLTHVLSRWMRWKAIEHFKHGGLAAILHAWTVVTHNFYQNVFKSLAPTTVERSVGRPVVWPIPYGQIVSVLSTIIINALNRFSDLSAKLDKSFKPHTLTNIPFFCRENLGGSRLFPSQRQGGKTMAPHGQYLTPWTMLILSFSPQVATRRSDRLQHMKEQVLFV